MISSNSLGIFALISEGFCGSTSITCKDICIFVDPTNADLPVAHSYRRTPSENKSLRRSTRVPSICSGAM